VIDDNSHTWSGRVQIRSHPLIDELVSAKFPQARYLDTADSDVLDYRERWHLQQSIKAYKTGLSYLKPIELEELARQQRQDPEYLRLMEEIEKDRLFNQPSALADVDHWTRLAIWDLEEANALLLGRDPSVVNTESVRAALPSSEFARKFFSLRQTLKRAELEKILRFPARPRALLDWAKAIELVLPSELETLIERRHQEVDWWRNDLRKKEDQIEMLTVSLERSEQQLKALHQTISEITSQGKASSSRERNTLDTIILAMAIDGYRYDPQATRSQVPSEIAEAAMRLGLSVTDETVRQKLKIASALIA
jgi:hypothetical protein